jgi:hypothetical protein
MVFIEGPMAQHFCLQSVGIISLAGWAMAKGGKTKQKMAKSCTIQRLAIILCKTILSCSWFPPS